MSDAQPRKRKNKGKKKEDTGGEEEIFTPLKNSSDEVIHVHKDVGCGGNIVTKLIFFGILASIGVMVGVILLEYRGSSDEETISALDSPWSVTFEQWVDNEADVHHAHDIKDGHEEEHDDHEEEHHDDHEEEHYDDHEKGHDDQNEVSSNGEASSIFSWFNFGEGGISKDDEEPTEDGGLFDSLLGLIPFGPSNEGDTGENGDVESSNAPDEESSEGLAGWFGFGGEKELVEEEEESHEEEEIEHEEEEEQKVEGEYEEEEDEEEEEDLDKDEDEEMEGEREEDEEIDHEEEETEEDDDLERDEEEEIDNEEAEEEEEEEDSTEHLREYKTIDDASEEEDDEDEGIDSWNNLSKYEEPEDEDEKNEQAVSDEDEVEELDETQKDEIDEGYEENISNEDDRDDENEEEEEEEKDSSEKQTSDNEVESAETENKLHQVGSDQSEEIPNEEELFPEAREALRREKEERELAKQAELEKELKEKEESRDEGFVEQENEPSSEGEEEETEGTGEDADGLISEASVTTEQKEEFKRELVTETPVSKPEIPPPTAAFKPPTPVPATPSPEPAEESPVEEEETGDEAGGEEEEESELEIDKDKFKELIAKYGQDTPESSDIEPSDDDMQKYSEGEESGGDEAEEESRAEVVSGDEPLSEDELKEWAGIKKSDIKKITKLDSESEGEVDPEEEEEEESEDEPPPPQPVQRHRGGPKDFEDVYPNDMITNEEDWAIREELDRADEEFNYEKAHSIFTALLEKHPNSPRARYGVAYSLDRLAETKQSNRLLETSIQSYFHALAAPNIPDNLFIKTGTRLINRLRFRGLHLKSIDVHKQLIKKFSSTPEYRNEMAITYLMINELENARTVLNDVLKLWPEDYFALAHYGLVLKLQGNIHGCIKYLERGLSPDFPVIKDARLFFHLGDALARVGRASEAEKVYDKGVAYGLFRSRYQRSLYNVDHLTGRPWWTHEQTTFSSFFKTLEDNWIQIKDEGVEALKLNGMFRDEAENLRDKGDWKQFELFARGSEIKNNCQVTPFTCSLIRSFEPAARCKRGQSKFSVMEGGTHVWPHCGPTNCRLRAHLGLIVPEGPHIRVANVTKRWEEGKVLVFDDSFEHEVWHNGTSFRLVLIVDVWHPELTRNEKLTLSPI